MNHTDAFGQTFGPGDLVIFSSGGAGHSTKIHIAEVLDITPAKEYGVNAEYDFPDGSAWIDNKAPRRVVSGVDVKVRTLATTWGRHGEVTTRKPTTPKTRNLVRWDGWDPRKDSND